MIATLVTLAHLHPHPAQMRTKIGLELVDLVVSLHTNGWFPDRPLVIAPAPDLGPDEYVIVRGHRRTLAWYLLKAVLKEDELTTRNTVEKALKELDIDLMTLYFAFAKHEDLYLPEVMRTDVDYAQQVLDLLSDNFGGEAPDVAGLLRTLKIARDTGSSWRKIGNSIGRSEGWVRDHVALLDLSPTIVEAVGAGKWAPGAALQLVKLPAARRQAAERFYADLLDRSPTSYRLNQPEVKTSVDNVAKFEEPKLDLLTATPFDYWSNLITVKLWETALAKDSGKLWDLVFYNATVRGDTFLRQLALHVDPTFVAGGEYSQKLNWPSLLATYAPEVTCEACPLNAVRAGHLRDTRSSGNNDGHYPCFAAKAGPCGDAPIAPAPDAVKLPYWISSHPSSAVFTAAEALQVWWEAEAKQKEEDTLPDTLNVPESNGPIVKQRARIADFIARHTELAVDHCLATTCATCEFKLEASPVKSDPDAPHCQWAARLKEVEFLVREPINGLGRCFPVCRQYRHADGPNWRDRIPYWPEKPSLDRATMLRMIRNLAYDQNAGVSQSYRTVLECFTGRGKTKDESMTKAFAALLTDQEPMLGNEQLFYLLMLVYAEWEPTHGEHDPDHTRSQVGYLLPNEGIYETTAWESFWTNRKRIRAQAAAAMLDPVLP